MSDQTLMDLIRGDWISKGLTSPSFVATISSEHSTSATSHQVRPGSISYTVNHTWLPSVVGRVMDAYTVFREEWLKWLLVCFIILCLLLILSELELDINVPTCFKWTHLQLLQVCSYPILRSHNWCRWSAISLTRGRLTS